MSAVDATATATDTAATKQILTIQVRNPVEQTIFVRSIIWKEENNKQEPFDADVLERDLTFYYSTLLGMKGCTVSVQRRTVPASLPMHMIGTALNQVPKRFPTFDVEFKTVAEIDKYYGLIEKVHEVENLRRELGVASPSTEVVCAPAPRGRNAKAVAAAIAAAAAAERAKASVSKKDSWMAEMLKEFERAAIAAKPVYEPFVEPDDVDTLAWVIAPIFKPMRQSRGYRIIVDYEVGKYWAKRLGTDLYPDMAVCRRYSTRFWHSNTDTSRSLAMQIIRWCIEVNTSESMLGAMVLSDWFHDAEQQLTSILYRFEAIGKPTVPTNTDDEEDAAAVAGGAGTGRGIAKGTAKGTEWERGVKEGMPVADILKKLADTHMFPLSIHPDGFQPSTTDWCRYVKHILRAHGYMSDIIDVEWSTVESHVAYWVDSGKVMNTNLPALLSRWEKLWEYTMHNRPEHVGYEEQFNMFLTTLDCHDPFISVGMRQSVRSELCKQWVRLFVEKELVRDSSYRIASAQCLEAVRKWALGFFPPSFAEHAFKPAMIGPILGELGLPILRTKRGRFLDGCTYKTPTDHIRLESIGVSIWNTTNKYFVSGIETVAVADADAAAATTGAAAAAGAEAEAEEDVVSLEASDDEETPLPVPNIKVSTTGTIHLGSL